MNLRSRTVVPGNYFGGRLWQVINSKEVVCLKKGSFVGSERRVPSASHVRITSDQPCLDSELFCTQVVSESTTFIINIFSGKGIYFCLLNIYNLHDYKYKAGL